jgi:hypothetical protein
LLLIPVLSAGRIRWLAKNGMQMLGEAITNRYRMVVVLMYVPFRLFLAQPLLVLDSAESGLIYSGALLLLLIMFLVGDNVAIESKGTHLTARLVAQDAIFPLVVQAAVRSDLFLPLLDASRLTRASPPPYFFFGLHWQPDLRGQSI